MVQVFTCESTTVIIYVCLSIKNIIFFIKSYQHPSMCLTLLSMLNSVYTSNTRFGSSQKMIHHRFSSNIAQKFYFHCLPMHIYGTLCQEYIYLSLFALSSVNSITTCGNTLFKILMIPICILFITTILVATACVTASMTPLYRELT